MTIAFDVLDGPFDGATIEALWPLASAVFQSDDREYFEWPLLHMRDLSIQRARDGDTPVGFKIGYAETSKRYYSWLGGVAASYRRQGIAAELLRRQHQWVRQRGYSSIQTATTEDNAAMLALNLSMGFRVIGTYNRGKGLRVMLLRDVD